MSISILWDNEEKSMVRFVYTGRWTWEDFYVQIDAANAMMDTVDSPCVSIIDMRASNYLPKGAAVHIRNVIRRSMSHNNSGISVFLQADVIVQVMIEVLQKSYPDILKNTEWIYAKTLDEARDLAQQQVNNLRAS